MSISLLSFADVIRASAIKPGRIIQLISDRRFPLPIPVNSRPMWWNDEIAAWLSERTAAREVA